MVTLTNKIIFYIVIMDENFQHHQHLRKLIHKIIPQAIIESIYDFNESIQFFRREAFQPHILFLSEEMSKSGLVISPDGYVNSYLLDEMPLVYLEDKQTPSYFQRLKLLRPYNKATILKLLRKLNQKWFK